ncbi:MAG: von Willebrand factor type A domain-containing protein [Saprospiraceae bacterium]
MKLLRNSLQSLCILFSFSIILFSCGAAEEVSDDAEQAYQEVVEEAVEEASQAVEEASEEATEPDIPTGDKYNVIAENPFVKTTTQPTSTFSIDADGASYTNVRRFIEENRLIPPAGAVRTEEMINFFDMNYAYKSSKHPIALNGEVAACPWKSGNQLVRIGIKGKPIAKADLPASNFVFLIDVSGSMNQVDKLGILKRGLNLMIDEMRPQDRIAIVTYAGDAGLVLTSTPCSDKRKIKQAINSLGSGGSTAGADGIITAYEIATKYFVEGGNNRIIVGTDGDFNVGPSSQMEIIELIEAKRDKGIFLSVLGVGRGNLNDAMLEQLANNGNGSYEYIDKVEQLEKIFIHDFSKFYTVAKDVKVQIKFDPKSVESYRLIGYANRVMNNEDFTDDKKDAGEIGANQSITALYEIVPKQGLTTKSPMFNIDFRYKKPNESSSRPMSLTVYNSNKNFLDASENMVFVGSVAAFSMLLMDSEYKGTTTYPAISKWLNAKKFYDPFGNKKDFKNLVLKAKSIQ